MSVYLFCQLLFHPQMVIAEAHETCSEMPDGSLLCTLQADDGSPLQVRLHLSTKMSVLSLFDLFICFNDAP